MSCKSFDVNIQTLSLYTSLICSHNLLASHSKLTSVATIVVQTELKPLYLSL